jgi:hypothetical protein
VFLGIIPAVKILIREREAHGRAGDLKADELFRQRGSRRRKRLPLPYPCSEKTERMGLPPCRCMTSISAASPHGDDHRHQAIAHDALFQIGQDLHEIEQERVLRAVINWDRPGERAHAKRKQSTPRSRATTLMSAMRCAVCARSPALVSICDTAIRT